MVLDNIGRGCIFRKVVGITTLLLLLTCDAYAAPVEVNLSVSTNISGSLVTFTATQNGLPVSGVKIYIDQSYKGTTNSGGSLSVTSSDGDHSWYAVYGSVSGRVDHGTYSVSTSISGNVVTFTATQNGLPVNGVTIYIDQSYKGTTNSGGSLSVTSSDGNHSWYAIYGSVSGKVDHGTYSVSNISVSTSISGSVVTFTATQNGLPVSGVTIYIDQSNKGTTNSVGSLSVTSSDGDHSWYAVYGSVNGRVDHGTYSISDISVSTSISGSVVTFTARQEDLDRVEKWMMETGARVEYNDFPGK